MANPNPPHPPDHTGKIYRTYKHNPKAALFEQLYLTPSSKTFMNIYQSGIASGYSEQYSSNISVQQPKWWLKIIESSEYRRATMLDAAEKALEDAVTTNSDDKDDRKIKHDAAKFISERLGKEHYSTRQEVTGADGRSVFANEDRERAKQPLSTLFKGVQAVK